QGPKWVSIPMTAMGREESSRLFSLAQAFRPGEQAWREPLSSGLGPSGRAAALDRKGLKVWPVFCWAFVPGLKAWANEKAALVVPASYGSRGPYMPPNPKAPPAARRGVLSGRRARGGVSGGGWKVAAARSTPGAGAAKLAVGGKISARTAASPFIMPAAP